jgi:transposase
MPQKFIECDRDQAFLLPPSLLDWVPQDHPVWTVLEAVEEMDLTAVYGVYRADGHGRPAYEPSMMVALLLYAYACGNRSSRRIERRCHDDLAYRVITANEAPDHSTIAEFRKRHMRALAGLFNEVLRLCGEAGLVNVSVLAVDGTKVAANASNMVNRDYEQIALEILAEAERIDREEDERFGDQRGDELPEELRTPAGRKAALTAAKERLRERRQRMSKGARGENDEDSDADGGEEDGGHGDGGDEDQGGVPGLGLTFDQETIVARVQGREGWLREAKRQLDEHRQAHPRPVPRDRLGRLLAAEQRLREDLAIERAANEAYEAYRARGVMKDGRRFGGPPKPYVPPEEPAGKANISDPDSKNIKGFRGYVQGYNAQAVVTEQQIIVAAELNTDPQDFSHLGPMMSAARQELTSAGVTAQPEVVVADAGYWHFQQIDQLAADGITVLIPPDAKKRKGARPGWDGGRYSFMRAVLAGPGRELYAKRHKTIEPVYGQIKHNRKIDRFLLRGRGGARCEWRLATATHNLLKLHQHRIAAIGA